VKLLVVQISSLVTLRRVAMAVQRLVRYFKTRNNIVYHSVKLVTQENFANFAALVAN
jgi:hypothetical protein